MRIVKSCRFSTSYVLENLQISANYQQSEYSLFYSIIKMIMEAQSSKTPVPCVCFTFLQWKVFLPDCNYLYLLQSIFLIPFHSNIKQRIKLTISGKMSSAKYCQSSVYFMNLHKNKLLQTMHQTKIIEVVKQYPFKNIFFIIML